MEDTIPLPNAELKTTLAGLGKIISRRSTLPVLGMVKVDRNNSGQVTLTATDLDHSVTAKLGEHVAGEPQSLLVPYPELLKVSKSCTKSDTLSVRSEKTSSGLSAIIGYSVGGQVVQHRCESVPVEEFPPIPEINGDSVSVNEQLQAAIRQAMQCASDDETRIILNGVFVDVSDPKCNAIVGTDGRHLYSSNSFTLPLPKSLIIPSHRFLGWKEFNEGDEWQIKVGAEVNKDEPPPFEITSARYRFTSRQHDGTYPNWRQVIPAPDQFATSVEFLAEDAQQIIKLVERLPDHDSVNHVVGLEVKGKRVCLLAKGQGQEPMTAVPVHTGRVSGKDVKIFLNRNLFTKALGFGLCRVEIIDPISPLRFSHEGRQMIAMPLRQESGVSQPVSVTQPAPEPHGQDEAAHSEVHQPAAPHTQDAAQPERRTNMQRTATNGSNGHSSNGNGEHEQKPVIETALEKIEGIKGSYREAIRGLNDLTDTLKQVQREHRASEKEVQSVRSTLEKLQSVRL